MEFDKVLALRRSTRQFLPEQISSESLEAILRAASYAPIGSNKNRDIHITVVEDKEILAELALASGARMADAKVQADLRGDIDPSAIPEQTVRLPFYGAPAVIFVSHRKQSLQPGIEYSNVAMVAFAMHLKATELGLGSVFVWGILESMRLNPDLDRTSLLKLPEGFSPLFGLMVGQPASPLKEREATEGKFAIDYL